MHIIHVAVFLHGIIIHPDLPVLTAAWEMIYSFLFGFPIYKLATYIQIIVALYVAKNLLYEVQKLLRLLLL